MILNSAPKCPHCAAWRPGARAFAVAFWFLLSVICLSVILLTVDICLKWSRQVREAKEEQLLNPQPQ
jgi:hypothetical protein